jgi:hypothetical protein
MVNFFTWTTSITGCILENELLHFLCLDAMLSDVLLVLISPDKQVDLHDGYIVSHFDTAVNSV